MTLEELLATPHPKYIGGSVYGIDFEKEMPNLDIVHNGQPLTNVELRNLFTHLLRDPEPVSKIVPHAWCDLIAVCLIDGPFALGLHGFSTVIQYLKFFGGPCAAGRVIEYLRRDEWKPFDLPFAARLLLRERGLETLPILAQVFKDKRSKGYYYEKSPFESLDEKRKELGISQCVWDLLLTPEPELAPESISKSRNTYAKKLEDFQERGASFTASDFRLLADHTIHGSNLHGLVLAVHSKDGGIKRTFALPDSLHLNSDESITIAHPASLTEDEIAQWKATFANEKREPPFDQWRLSRAILHRDVKGITSNPADLLLYLESLGWQRGRAGSGGVIRDHYKTFPDLDQTAVVEYEPGVPTKPGGRWTLQAIAGCRFRRESSGEPINEPSPIALSTVQRDLFAIGGKRA